MTDQPTESELKPCNWQLADLRAANIERQEEWCPDEKPDLSFRGNELAGEAGEACNVIKKLERERHGWRGSRASLAALAEELADVVICADLCALVEGIDLQRAVQDKFDATSKKNGLATRLATRPAETELQSLRSEVERLNATLDTILKDPDYEGGVQYWMRKYDDLSLLTLASLEQLRRERNTARAKNAELVKALPSVRNLVTASRLYTETDPEDRTEDMIWDLLYETENVAASLKAYDALAKTGGAK